MYDYNHLMIDLWAYTNRYLGVPLLHHRVTKATYQFPIQKVLDRLLGWLSKTLSFTSRVTLVKCVLEAIPLYVMQTTLLPKAICRDIENVIRKFLCGSSSEGRLIHLLSWEVLCKPMLDGGLGFKNLEEQNCAFLMKLAFGLVSRKDELWTDSLGWLPSSDRSFSVRMAYRIRLGFGNTNAEPIWKTIAWFQGNQRLQTFLWLLADGRVLTNVERAHRHLTSNDRRGIYGGVVESLDHLFRFCLTSSLAWRSVVQRDHWVVFCNLPFQEWLRFNLTNSSFASINGEDWPQLFGVVL
ncbi:hypothetical protein GQ457_15G017520 [Hibiscus cannabinus]